MNVLVLGADGYIGSAIAISLRHEGHTVVRGVHHQRLSDDIVVNYRRARDLIKWQKLLKNIDAVINAVGILREKQDGDFLAIHAEAPTALFTACALAGVKKLVHISALGPSGVCDYLDSKRMADTALLATFPNNATIVRPGLVFGGEGVSTKIFMRLARLPLLPVPKGIGQLQPVFLDDLVEVVEKCLTESHFNSRVIDVPGPRALSFAEWLDTLRTTVGLADAPRLMLPQGLCSLTAHLAGLFPGSLLCPDTWKLLLAGNTGDGSAARELLGRRLKDPKEFIL